MHTSIVCFYLQPSVSIDFCKNVDITKIPKPLPATVSTSTNSRFFLKYCAIITIEQSLVNPTPKPTTIPVFVVVVVVVIVVVQTKNTMKIIRITYKIP